jgi:hypothetical protein
MSEPDTTANITNNGTDYAEEELSKAELFKQRVAQYNA